MLKTLAATLALTLAAPPSSCVPGERTFVYPPPSDGIYLNTKQIFSSSAVSLFILRGHKDAESSHVFDPAQHYIWDIEKYGQDPNRALAAKEKEWKGLRVADGRTPVFYFSGHCYDFKSPTQRKRNGKIVYVNDPQGPATPDGKVRIAASHSTGADKKLWEPSHLLRLLRFARSVSPPGVRPVILFSGCGCGYPPNRPFLRWLSQQPGKPYVVASATRTHTRTSWGSPSVFAWGWPSMTNIVVFDDGTMRRLGDEKLPAVLQKW